MVNTVVTTDATRWDNLVDRLRAHDVRYLTGGSATTQRDIRTAGAASATRDAGV